MSNIAKAQIIVFNHCQQSTVSNDVLLMKVTFEFIDF